jgi:hypothetical protein
MRMRNTAPPGVPSAIAPTLGDDDDIDVVIAGWVVAVEDVGLNAVEDGELAAVNEEDNDKDEPEGNGEDDWEDTLVIEVEDEKIVDVVMDVNIDAPGGLKLAGIVEKVAG